MVREVRSERVLPQEYAERHLGNGTAFQQAATQSVEAQYVRQHAEERRANQVALLGEHTEQALVAVLQIAALAAQ